MNKRDIQIKHIKEQAETDVIKGRKIGSFERNMVIHKGDKVVQREYEKEFKRLEKEKPWLRLIGD